MSTFYFLNVGPLHRRGGGAVLAVLSSGRFSVSVCRGMTPCWADPALGRPSATPSRKLHTSLPGHLPGGWEPAAAATPQPTRGQQRTENASQLRAIAGGTWLPPLPSPPAAGAKAAVFPVPDKEGAPAPSEDALTSGDSEGPPPALPSEAAGAPRPEHLALRLQG